MAKKQVTRLNLSDHTLDIRFNRQSLRKLPFDIDDIDDFLKELTDTRTYQYESIRQIMFYLWGSKYTNVTDLAKENWQQKPTIKQRFTSEKQFLNMLPLPDKLSGVVHMATGTGKSYVIFAVAYLSIILGLVKRVLIIGPSSTIIEEGLWGKIKDHINGQRGQDLIKKLPPQYRNIPINFCDEKKPIEDFSITVENINAIFNQERNSIGDTLFKNTDEVLVLSDEVHHAYSHLNFRHGHLNLDEGGRGETRDERLWMKFLRTKDKIKRHIGFTGTPYMSTSSTDKGNDYFTDVIYNHSIKDATDKQYIKYINPIIHTESEEEFEDLTLDQRFEMIIKNHQKNIQKYSYVKNRQPQVKPITIFICRTQKSAQDNTDKFIDFLARYQKNLDNNKKSLSHYQVQERNRVMCVISKPGEERYDEELRTIEELNNKKEFIFAVNRLSEGWDVDNVFQIVPMEDRVFNSRLLISQVLGRGLRIPRKIKPIEIKNTYPVVTITNHEKFADHIKELVDSVTMCETRLSSQTLRKKDRSKYNFNLFNINYLPNTKIVEKTKKELKQTQPKRLNLLKPKKKLKFHVYFNKGDRKFKLKKDFHTLDDIVFETVKLFENHQFESKHFDFGYGNKLNKLPSESDINKVILKAMKRSGFKDNLLSDTNRQTIQLFFNQFLPKGKGKRVFEKVQGDLIPIETKKMDKNSIRASEMEKEAMVFMSDDFQQELTENNLFVLNELNKKFKTLSKQQSSGQVKLFDVQDKFIQQNPKYVKHLFGSNSPVIVNKQYFKTPLSIVFTSHKPEKEFVYQLIKHHKYIDSWIKARDMGFYSLDYEYWKRGKDRKKASFNPDFFIKQGLKDYINQLESINPDLDLSKLKKLEEQGRETLIRVVEIKSDEDDTEATPAKEKHAKEHFKLLNERLKSTPTTIDKKYQTDFYQYYTFDLLRPLEFPFWFSNLTTGSLRLKI